MTGKRDAFKLDLLVVAIIAIAGIKFTWGLEHVVDIPSTDESKYLLNGVLVPIAGFGRVSYGPIYWAWYFLLSLLQPDRVQLYFLNYQLTAILPSIPMYIALRRIGIPIHTSLISSLVLLVSRVNAFADPRVSHFALIVMLVTLAVLGRLRLSPWAALIASAGALAMSYVRPELFLTFLLFALGGIILMFKDRRSMTKATLASQAIVLAILFGLVALVGTPVMGQRSFTAFAQHFSINWNAWTGFNYDLWLKWRDITMENFGIANSIPAAFTANPAMFLKHIAYNGKQILVSESSQAFPVNFPTDALTKLSIAALAIVGLSLGGSRIYENFKTHRLQAAFVGGLLIPSIISLLVIYPRDHYFLLFFSAFIVLAAISFDGLGPRFKNYNGLVTASICVAAIGLTPLIKDNAYPYQPNLLTINYLRSLGITQPVTIFDAHPFLADYVGPNYSDVIYTEKNSSFDLLVKARNINMIISSPELMAVPDVTEDATWKVFAGDLTGAGFVKVGIPGTTRELIYRSDLLNPAAASQP